MIPYTWLNTGALSPLLIAASDMQSALAPAGRQAAEISQLWWLYLWVLTGVFALVAIALFFAILRRGPASAPLPAIEPVLAPSAATERRISTAVIGCVAATVLILFVLLFRDFIAGRSIDALSGDKEFLSIKVIGHQWWWEVQYNDSAPSNVMVTANDQARTAIE